MPDDNKKNRPNERRADCVEFTCKYQQGRMNLSATALAGGQQIEDSSISIVPAATKTTTPPTTTTMTQEMFSKQTKNVECVEENR